MDIKNIKVLYVDDEFLNLRSFEILFSNKFSVYTASSGIKALEIIESQNIDVIVSDQRMPKMSGVELLKKVKEMKKNILKIIHSGFLDDTDVQSAVENGIAEFLLDKPLDENRLIEIITDNI